MMWPNRRRPWHAILLPLLYSNLPKQCMGDSATHSYKAGDDVDLWMNKVGPYSNPQEAYEYYTLPYCKSTKSHAHLHNIAKDDHSLGEILGGHSLRHSGVELHFSDDLAVEECSTDPLTEDQAAVFGRAVAEQYFYQMYLDDLPVWGMVGEMLPANGDANAVETAEDLVPFVYQERHLAISYNQDRIVKVDLTSEPNSLTPVLPGAVLKFKLTSEWTEATEEFHSRFDRYLDHAFFKHQIHWFSIFNSFMMVLFLTGLVTLIFLRTLKKDYARYARASSVEEDTDEEEGEPKEHDGHAPGMTEDSGWKQVHGDVFRAPSQLPVFAALLGTGWQLIALSVMVILFAVAGPLHGDVYEERGEMLHAVILCYSVSSIVAGYSSGTYFKKYFSTSQKTPTGVNIGNQAWQGVMALTAILLPTFFVIIISILNAISLYYQTIYCIPFIVIFKMFALWVFVSVPLCIIGTLMGRHSPFFAKKLPRGADSYFPCRVNAIPRPIPLAEETPWFGQPKYLIPLSGILPFGSIFIELYYVLTSLWNYKYYHVYGFMMTIFTILTIVVSMTSIISTYFCLNAENYHWQWNAFWSGASLAMYVFLYGVYYFLCKTSMYGLLQTAFYFGYTALISICLGCLCGTLGHCSSSKFVRTIFQNVKVD